MRAKEDDAVCGSFECTQHTKCSRCHLLRSYLDPPIHIPMADIERGTMLSETLQEGASRMPKGQSA